MNYSFGTDKGIKRSNNQDCCAVLELDDNVLFAVVCDGMGGASAGEVASKIAVDTVTQRMETGWRTDMADDSVKNLMLTSITAANINVYDQSISDSDCSGMGTTIVACVLFEDHGIVAHAGDSRAYLFTDSLQPLTKDHSLVQELVDQGRITEAEAKIHPHKNYITRALGVDEDLDIDFNTFGFPHGATLLLCSDGLFNFASDDEIIHILQDVSDDTARQLIGLANSNGGGDNVTAVVISKQ